MRERGNLTAVNYLFQNAQNMHNGISEIKIGWSGFNPLQYTTYWCVDIEAYYEPDSPEIEDIYYTTTLHIDLISGIVTGSSGGLGHAVSK